MTDVTRSDSAGQIRLLSRLRQIRQLRSDLVPDAALNDILEVARWTGSARNLQNWDFIVITDRATLQKLATIEGGRAPHLANASLGIALVMSGQSPYETFDTYDEGRLSERIMLAAAAHGLASAIGWFGGSASEEAKKILGVPPERLLRSAVSIGHVDEEARRQRARPAEARKPLGSIVHHERW